MNKIFVLLMLSSLFFSGCGTFMAREGGISKDFKIYPATRADSEAIYVSVTGQSIFQHGDCDNANWFGQTIGYTIVPICFLVDLPISLITDTVMFPFDLTAKPIETTTQGVSYNPSLKGDEDTADVCE